MGELFEKLGIDWRLFLAQIINFLILLFVLYKFLYKPVLKMLHDRTSRIEKSLSDAQKIEANLKLADEERMVKIAEARKEAQKIIEEGKKESETIRREMTEATKSETEKIVKAGKEQLAAQKETLLKEAKKEIAGLVIAASEKVLKEVANEKTDQAIAETVVKNFGK